MLSNAQRGAKTSACGLRKWLQKEKIERKGIHIMAGKYKKMKSYGSKTMKTSKGKKRKVTKYGKSGR